MTRIVPKEDIISDKPYLDKGQWCVDEQLNPAGRGYITHRFNEVDEALRFMSHRVVSE